jgi:hypothetical protein
VTDGGNLKGHLYAYLDNDGTNKFSWSMFFDFEGKRKGGTFVYISFFKDACCYPFRNVPIHVKLKSFKYNKC